MNTPLPPKRTYHKVDVEKLTPKRWRHTPSNNTFSPLVQAFLSRQVQDIPPSILTRPRSVMLTRVSDWRNLTLLHIAVLTNTLKYIPKKALTARMFSCADSNGTTPLHLAYEFLTWRDIPPEILCQCKFNAKDFRGITPLAVALSNDAHMALPTNVFSLKNLLQKDNRGITCLHRAMKRLKPLYSSISEALQPKYMSIKDERGRTPLHYAAFYNTIHLLPPDCRTTKLLHIKNLAKLTPMEEQLYRPSLSNKTAEPNLSYLHDIELSEAVRFTIVDNWDYITTL